MSELPDMRALFDLIVAPAEPTRDGTSHTWTFTPPGWTYRGKPLEDMTREELIAAVIEQGAELRASESRF